MTAAGAVLTVRCMTCNGNQELPACTGRPQCNHTWLARLHGWWKQGARTHCAACTGDQPCYNPQRLQWQAEAMGTNIRNTQVCYGCREAAIALGVPVPVPPPADLGPPPPGLPGPDGSAAASEAGDSDDSRSPTPEPSDARQARIRRRLRRGEAAAAVTQRQQQDQVPQPPPTTTLAVVAPPQTAVVCRWCPTSAPPKPTMCRNHCGETWWLRACGWTGNRKKMYCSTCSEPAAIQKEEAMEYLCTVCKSAVQEYTQWQ